MKLNISIKQSLISGLAINLLALVLFGVIAFRAIDTLNGNQQALSQVAAFEAEGGHISKSVGDLLARNSQVLSASNAQELDEIGSEVDTSGFEQALAADRDIVANMDLTPAQRQGLESDLKELENRFVAFTEESRQFYGQSLDILLLEQRMPELVVSLDQQTDQGISQIAELSKELGHLVTRTSRQFLRSIRSLDGTDREAMYELRSGFQEIMFGNVSTALTVSEQIRFDMVKLTALSRRMMLIQDPAQLQSLKEEALDPLDQSLLENLERLEGLLYEEKSLQEKSAALSEQYQNMRALLAGDETALHETKVNQLNQRTELASAEQELGQSMAGVLTQLDQLSQKARAVAASVNASSAEVADGARITMLIGGLIVAVLMLVVGMVLLARIITPLNFISGRMDEIANGDGDLTARISLDRGDEVGRLAQNFNAFVALIQDLVRKTAGASEEVSRSTEQTAASAELMAEGVDAQKREIDSVVSAVQEMAYSLEDVSSNVASTSSSASEVDDLARAGREQVNMAIQRIRDVATYVQKGTVVVGQLNDDSQTIGEVLDVITSISERTNLLALNAAIEAARAGEAGRGFSVVADEVRNLAQQTQESTARIQAIIEKLRANAQAANEAIGLGHKESLAAVESADTAGSSLSQVT